MTRWARRGVVVLTAVTLSAVVASPAAASPYADTVLADQPSSYWRFGEPAGQTQLADVSGGASTTAWSATPGVPGALAGDADTAVEFDGRTTRYPGRDVVRAALPGAFDFGGRRPFTLEAWVKPRNLNTHTRRVFSTGEWGDAGGVLVGVRADGLVFSRYAAGRWSTLKTPVRADAWAHVAASYDGAVMRLFVDGQLRASAPSVVDVPANRDGELWIGAKGYEWKYYAGVLDEPAVYPQALPAVRVAVHYRAGAGR